MSLENPTQKNDFEKQFMRTAPVSIGEDINLQVHVLENEEAGDKNFVFFAPSFGMLVEDMYKDHALKAMYDMKRSILTFDPPAKGAEFVLTPEEEKAIEGHGSAPEEIRMAKLLLKVLEDPKIREKIGAVKIDVAAHSRGLGYVVLAALMKPELFRTIAGYGGVGLIGKDNLASLSWRMRRDRKQYKKYNPVIWGGEPTDMRQLAQKVANDRKPKSDDYVTVAHAATEEEIAAVQEELEAKKKAAHERGIDEYAPTPEQMRIMREVARKAPRVLAKYIWAAPGRRLREIRGLANIRIDEAIFDLSRLHKINFVLMNGNSDLVFPSDRQKYFMFAPEFKDANVLLVSVQGIHGTLGDLPIIAREMIACINVVNARATPDKAV